MSATNADQAIQPGEVAIQDGRVVVRIPAPDSPRPSLTPGAHVVLKVNGQVVTQTVVIDENDDVTIEATDEQPFKEVRVEVAKDGSEAIVHIVRRPAFPTHSRMCLSPRTWPCLCGRSASFRRRRSQ